MPAFTPQLQSEYQRLFDTCSIKPEQYPIVDATINKILAGRPRYEMVSGKTNIPWYFIGIIHSLECSSNFKCHLHNGDPLTGKTVQVPKGYPRTGNPPFTWETSAEDALALKKLNTLKDWSIPSILYQLEAYNGFGYRKAQINIPSPYLWSFSNHYNKGKFVADGSFSATAVSKQCGAAVLLRRLYERQIVSNDSVDRAGLIKQLGESVTYAPNKYNAKAEELQKLLNASGAFLKADGKAGKNTSDAYFKIVGKYLPGDPRQ